ncbi:NAD(P)-binding protein [Bimuria novae-zelandiae CBS 107.79]|uniref:NAD(P)-binding protein n=1 Tax=Bimuria novae-zelandiae CBS 107.79 TaxID=1447943 RepID=A0A6A5USU8_9PLEO|nr:NAD(P)-binding protein [Bimuria novae-zelandiae CBS 107.79]
MSVKRIAVAGTCGLALIIARQIHDSTSHQLIILSRSLQPGLQSQGYQCQVVDYNDPSSIQHSLLGVDTIISTITGNAQLRLIEAAVASRVRRFVPAEFEGRPSLRTQNGLLDRGRAAALALLQHYRGYIQSTVFVCGIFYERFSVNGMVSLRIGVNTGYGNEGDYMADPRNMTAVAPVYDSSQNLSVLCLTSVYDVARFVIRALDMSSWPAEMSMCGERMTVQNLIETMQSCRGRQFYPIEWQNPANLQYQMTMAQMAGDTPKQRKLATLIETSENRYAFTSPGYLNSVFPDIAPMSFRSWFTNNWASVS